MSDGRKKGPYGCKCQTLAHKLVGDGCDECQPMSDGIDHEGYTVAAVEEAQLVTDLRAENARLREIVTTLAVGKKRNAKPSPAQETTDE